MQSKTKVRALLLVMMLAILPGVVITAVSTAQGVGVAVGPADPVARDFAVHPPSSGINVDGYFPDSLDPICGLQIVLTGSKPVSFYNAGRNPWGPPTITEWFPGSGIWIVRFGGPTGPCFPRSYPDFWNGTQFLGLHFGFYTDDPAATFVDADGSNSPCVYFGVNGPVPCTGIIGYHIYNWGVALLNGNDQVFAVQNAEIAVADGLVPLNELTRRDLDHLEWEPLDLEGSILPAASDAGPGRLDVGIPDHIRNNSGWAVLSYDVANPETGEVVSTVTLEFPLGAGE